MPDWKNPRSMERLLGAFIASIDGKIDYSAIAKYFGEGTTYSAIENRFRPFRKMADQLRAEAGEDAHKVTPGRRQSTKLLGGKGKKSEAGETKQPTTPRKRVKTEHDGDAVISGRVSKSTSKSKSITPTASRKKAVAGDRAIKKDPMDTEEQEAIGESETAIEAESLSNIAADLMEKDSSDEVFDLQSFDGSMDDFGSFDGMDCH